jgi:hypothetical protein
MRMTPAQYQAYVAKSAEGKTGISIPPQNEQRESKLSDSIAAWCASQWPKWLVIRARTDQKSTIAVGCQDLTIFAPNGRIFLFELKAKDGKLSLEQAAWIAGMRMLGHHVQVIRSMEEFLSAIHA